MSLQKTDRIKCQNNAFVGHSWHTCYSQRLYLQIEYLWSVKFPLPFLPRTFQEMTLKLKVPWFLKSYCTYSTSIVSQPYHRAPPALPPPPPPQMAMQKVSALHWLHAPHDASVLERWEGVGCEGATLNPHCLRMMLVEPYSQPTLPGSEATPNLVSFPTNIAWVRLILILKLTLEVARLALSEVDRKFLQREGKWGGDVLGHLPLLVRGILALCRDCLKTSLCSAEHLRGGSSNNFMPCHPKGAEAR